MLSIYKVIFYLWESFRSHHEPTLVLMGIRAFPKVLKRIVLMIYTNTSFSITTLPFQ